MIRQPSKLKTRVPYPENCLTDAEKDKCLEKFKSYKT